jgi:hypothetical protein
MGKYFTLTSGFFMALSSNQKRQNKTMRCSLHENRSDVLRASKSTWRQYSIAGAAINGQKKTQHRIEPLS